MTFALVIGNAIGRTVATVEHVACVSATYTGQFGVDLAAGTAAGYTSNSERLATARAERAARPVSIAIKVAMPAALKAKLATAA